MLNMPYPLEKCKYQLSSPYLIAYSLRRSTNFQRNALRLAEERNFNLFKSLLARVFRVETRQRVNSQQPPPQIFVMDVTNGDAVTVPKPQPLTLDSTDNIEEEAVAAQDAAE